MDNIFSKQLYNDYELIPDKDRFSEQLLDASAFISNRDKLATICVQIKNSLKNRRIVTERTMLDFSRLTYQMLYSGAVDAIPNEFVDLAERADDYWKYKAYDEENKELCFSYVRIYQITSMVTVFVNDRKRKEKLEKAVEMQKKHYELLEYMYVNPGIMHKDLCEYMGISKSVLSHRTKQLEEQGIVFGRRVGNNKLYSLSNFGISLFNQLKAKEQMKTQKSEQTNMQRQISWLASVLQLFWDYLNYEDNDLSISELSVLICYLFRKDVKKYETPTNGFFMNQINQEQNIAVIYQIKNIISVNNRKMRISSNDNKIEEALRLIEKSFDKRLLDLELNSRDVVYGIFSLPENSLVSDTWNIDKMN